MRSQSLVAIWQPLSVLYYIQIFHEAHAIRAHSGTREHPSGR